MQVVPDPSYLTGAIRRLFLGIQTVAALLVFLCRTGRRLQRTQTRVDRMFSQARFARLWRRPLLLLEQQVPHRHLTHRRQAVARLGKGEEQ